MCVPEANTLPSHKKMYHGTLAMYHGTSAVYHGTFSYGLLPSKSRSEEIEIFRSAILTRAHKMNVEEMFPEYYKQS